ncbi:BatD family protein [Sulfurimonas sp.]|uniref:BatD family protein n=1 Tax=Sulfurimonas sp. TaxID=2022749 RepID=UPI003D0B5505
MKNLGKFFIFFIFLTTTLFAGVKAELSPDVATMGDVVSYSLKVDGSDVSAPSLYQLCGQNIISSGSRTNIEMIGSDYKKTKTFVYQFVAQKSCTIEPVALTIDGKTVKSNSVSLTVEKQTQKAGQPFFLSYDISKTDPYVGESVKLTLTLRQRKDVSVIDNKFIPSDFKGFWKKSESKPKQESDGAYVVTKVEYTLTPQREGNLTITPAELRVASRVNASGWSPSFMPQVQWKSYFSNELNIDVKPLPNNAKFIGDFTIDAKADKTTTNPNEAVNVVVSVKGSGNLEDIESFKPHIDGVNVFDEKIEINDDVLTQKLVFVGDHDFTIEPFVLTYFDTKTKQLKRIQTEAIDITLKGSAVKPQQPLTIKKDETPQVQKSEQKDEIKQETSTNVLYIVFALFVGIFIGVSIMLLKDKTFTNSEKKVSIKDEKLLLMKLLPYKERDSEIKKIVETLEKNLYTSEKEEIDKKRLKELLKKYNIT